MARTKHRHRISDVDSEARTGTCAVCGPNVPLYRINNRTAGVVSWRCRKSSTTTAAYVTKKGEHRIRVSPADRELLLDASGATCGVCGKTVTSETMRPDHEHGTLRFRGVLCHRCNLGLGYFDDSLESLRKAVSYLERYEREGCVLEGARGFVTETV